MRINMMQGVAGDDPRRQINEEFPRNMHMHPIMALMYVALELANQGHLNFVDDEVVVKRNPFVNMMGVRPEFIHSMEDGTPTINMMSNYERFGLRRKSVFARWQNVEHIVRTLIPSRLNRGDMTSSAMRKLMSTFGSLE